MRPIHRTVLAVAMALAAPAGAESPLSAIDWLSDSVTTPTGLPLATMPDAAGDAGGTALPTPITVAPLDGADPVATGILPPSQTGLPRDFWGASSGAEIADLLRAEPHEMLPAMQRLLRVILLADLDPPAGADGGADLLLARLDRLLELGLVEDAEALLAQVDAEDPRLFRRAFDIALLTGAENDACTKMRRSPDISPTYTARIFCLARGGDWQAAALTLESAKALEILGDDDDLILAGFLDPELFEETTPPPAPRQPSPLTFRLYEAIGERPATTGLPLAFAHADLRETVGWKARLEAGERLAATGALPAERLFALYAERRPAASGGVWDRVAAIQALDAALADGATEAVAGALPAAWAAMEQARLEAPFAERYGPRLAALPLEGAAGALAFRIGLLSEDYENIAAAHRPTSADERMLVALARGLPVTAPEADRLMLAVRDGMTGNAVPARYRPMIDEDRLGAATLTAIRQFSEGAYGDYTRTAEALAALRAIGLESTARRAALELLILERRG